MQKFHLPDGFGLAEVRFGEREPVVVDLWEVNATYGAIRDRNDGDPVKTYTEFGEYLAGKGFKDLSHAMIEGMIIYVRESVETLKKKEPFSPSPDSPASTESTAPPSPVP